MKYFLLYYFIYILVHYVYTHCVFINYCLIINKPLY